MAQITATTADQAAAVFKFQNSDTINGMLEKASALSKQALIEVINSPHGEERTTLLGAAEQTLKLVNNLRLGYDQSGILKVTYELVGRQTQLVFEDLENLCRELTAKDAKALATRVSINAAPIKGSYPYLEKMEPQVVTVVKNLEGTSPVATKVDLTFTGQFPKGGDKKWDHSLTLNGKKYEPIERSNTALKYQIEVSSSADETSECSILEGTLQVAWSTGYVYSWATSQFSHPLIVRQLPPVPFQVTALFCKTEEKQIWQDLVKFDRLPKQPIHFSISPEEGWRIKAGSVHHSFFEAVGGTPHLAITPPESSEKINGHYYSKQGTPSGYFQVGFTQIKEVRTQQSETLGWGKEVVFAPQNDAKIEKVILINPMTKVETTVLPQSGSPHEFVQLSEQEGKLVIKAKELKDLAY